MNDSIKTLRPPLPKKTKIFLSFGIAILVLLLVVIFTTISKSPEEGDDSKLIELSQEEDEKVLAEKFGISAFLPIESKDPSFKISYSLDFKDSQYTFALLLNSFSASGREEMIQSFLSSNFGSFDPLDYEIILENYYNPLSSLPLENLKESIPENFSIEKSFLFENSSLRVTLLSHSLYDGGTNTYRLVEKKSGDSWAVLKTPEMIYSYSDFPELSHALIREINSL